MNHKLFRNKFYRKHQPIKKVLLQRVDSKSESGFAFIFSVIQSILSIAAIGIAVYTLHIEGIRDSESSKRNAESVIMEKSQHTESMKVYLEQKELLQKYNASADKMLEQQKIQAKVAKMQFDNQVILSQPQIIVDYDLHDTLKTSLLINSEKRLMPEVKLKYRNIGNRIANDIKIKLKIISPSGGIVFTFPEVIEPFLCYTCNNYRAYYPIVDQRDKSMFFMVQELEWTDVFNNDKKEVQKIYLRCIREKNDNYTIGKTEGKALLAIKEIEKYPTRTLSATDEIVKNVHEIYNR